MPKHGIKDPTGKQPSPPHTLGSCHFGHKLEKVHKHADFLVNKLEHPRTSVSVSPAAPVSIALRPPEPSCMDAVRGLQQAASGSSVSAFRLDLLFKQLNVFNHPVSTSRVHIVMCARVCVCMCVCVFIFLSITISTGKTGPVCVIYACTIYPVDIIFCVHLVLLHLSIIYLCI